MNLKLVLVNLLLFLVPGWTVGEDTVINSRQLCDNIHAGNFAFTGASIVGKNLLMSIDQKVYQIPMSYLATTAKKPKWNFNQTGLQPIRLFGKWSHHWSFVDPPPHEAKLVQMSVFTGKNPKLATVHLLFRDKAVLMQRVVKLNTGRGTVGAGEPLWRYALLSDESGKRSFFLYPIKDDIGYRVLASDYPTADYIPTSKSHKWIVAKNFDLQIPKALLYQKSGVYVQKAARPWRNLPLFIRSFPVMGFIDSAGRVHLWDINKQKVFIFKFSKKVQPVEEQPLSDYLGCPLASSKNTRGKAALFLIVAVLAILVLLSAAGLAYYLFNKEDAEDEEEEKPMTDDDQFEMLSSSAVEPPKFPQLHWDSMPKLPSSFGDETQQSVFSPGGMGQFPMPMPSKEIGFCLNVQPEASCPPLPPSMMPSHPQLPTRIVVPLGFETTTDNLQTVHDQPIESKVIEQQLAGAQCQLEIPAQPEIPVPAPPPPPPPPPPASGQRSESTKESSDGSKSALMSSNRLGGSLKSEGSDRSTPKEKSGKQQNVGYHEQLLKEIKAGFKLKRVKPKEAYAEEEESVAKKEQVVETEQVVKKQKKQRVVKQQEVVSMEAIEDALQKKIGDRRLAVSGDDAQDNEEEEDPGKWAE